MDLKRGNTFRPNDTLLIMMSFNYDSHSSFQTNAIRTHVEVFQGTVRGHKSAFHGLTVDKTNIENIAEFDGFS